MSSGNFMLFKRKSWWEPSFMARLSLMADMEKRRQSIGSLDDVKKRIEALFPDVRWSQFSAPQIVPLLREMRMKGPVWYGNAGFEIQLDRNDHDEVVFVNVSRASPWEVRKLRRGLGMVSMTLDADSLLGMIFF